LETINFLKCGRGNLQVAKNFKDENDIKILLATTLISIILAALLFNTQIQTATAATNQTQKPTSLPGGLIRVEEKVGEVTLWTPILILKASNTSY